MSDSVAFYVLRSRDDPIYQKYLKIFLACQEANVNLPPEVNKYYGGGEGEYDGDGIDNEPDWPLELSFEPKVILDDNYEIWEINIDDLPVGAKIIRVVH